MDSPLCKPVPATRLPPPTADRDAPEFELVVDERAFPGVAASTAPVYVGFGRLGLSLFAARHVEAGEHILRFSGPIVTFEDAVAKGQRQCYPLQISSHRYIDLAEPGCYA